MLRRARVTPFGRDAVINATGIFVDGLRQQDSPGVKTLLSVSRGTHVVVAGDFLQQGALAASAIMVPKTRDGRIIFAIPWLGKVVIGTTEVPVAAVEMEPGHDESEIAFLLETINPYLARAVTRADILSIFSGLRPLVTGAEANTAKLSREHHIDSSASGLVTVAGGKWTTYRRMAEDTLDFAIAHKLLPPRACVSKGVRLHGAPAPEEAEARRGEPLAQYGTDAEAVRRLAQEDHSLNAGMDEALAVTAAEVVYAVREEMARTVEDVLSRRTRALLLDARAAERAAPAVAAAMAPELGKGEDWIAAQVAGFRELARRFYQPGGDMDDGGSAEAEQRAV